MDKLTINETSRTSSIPQWAADLQAFMSQSQFLTRGAVVIDLDGTAVHEYEGRVRIHPDVSHALKRIADRGRPVVINSLRFPLNVISTFGEEWASITTAPLPIISLNGSQMGYLTSTSGELAFQELAAFPLSETDIEGVLSAVARLLENEIRNLVLFFYPRDWRYGEIIWVGDATRVDAVRAKYASASECYSSTPGELRTRLDALEVCMMFLLIDEPEDRLMAYQHPRPKGFVTQAGVDKSFGWRAMCQKLGWNAVDCIGAGDTPMDTFLGDCGLALHVGPLTLQKTGHLATIKLRGPHELGSFLFAVSEFEGEKRHER